MPIFINHLFRIVHVVGTPSIQRQFYYLRKIQKNEITVEILFPVLYKMVDFSFKKLHRLVHLND